MKPVNVLFLYEFGMKSKLLRAISLILLAFLHLATPARPIFVDEGKVKSFIIERKSQFDTFTVIMKANHECTSSDLLHKWCESLNAHDPKGNRSFCSCECWTTGYSFISPEQKCIAKRKVAGFGGCKNYFDADVLLTQPPVDLSAKYPNNTYNTSTTVNAQVLDNCSVSGQYYYDYSGFQSRWKRLSANGFFTSKVVLSSPGWKKLRIEWPNPDTNNTLFGRIIRLNISCTKSYPASSFSRCMLLRAIGTVTYYGPLSSTTSTVYQDVSTTPVGSQRHLSLSTSSTPFPSLPLSQKSLEELSNLPHSTSRVRVVPPLSSTTSTMYQDISTTPVGSQRHLSLSTSSTPFPSLPLPQKSLKELSTSSLPRPSSSSIQYIPPPPSSVLTKSPLTPSPSIGLFSVTSRSLRMTQSISSLVPSSQIKTTKLPEVTSGQMQTTLSSKDLPKKSEDSGDKEVSTANLPHSSSRVRAVPPATPPKPSTPKPSRSTGGVVPADKGGRTGGNGNGTVVGAAVGGALVLGIVVIIVLIVFWKRRKALDTKGKQAKPGKTHNLVTNPVYETSDNDIQLEVSKGMKTKSSPAQDNQYQGLIIENGQSNGAAIYSSADSNYDNCVVYQSLDKQTPSSPVYQALDESLLEGAPTTGILNSKHTTPTDPKIKPSAAGIPASEGNGTIGVPKSKSTAAGESKRGSSAAQDPVYNVLDGPGAGQETMTEPLYNVLEGQDYAALTVDPLYSIPEGRDSEEDTPGGGPGTTEEAVYNVLEGPNAINSPTNEQGPSENDAIYNVLESPDAEKSPLVGNEPSNEPLYNVLEEQNGHGSNQGLPKESLHTGAHDNPSYEQTLEFNEPYADVHRPETQRESLYEPLRRPREDLYEPLA